MIQTLGTADDEYIGADTETTSLKWFDNGQVVGHCLSCRKGGIYYGYYVPVRHVNDENCFDVDWVEETLKLAVYEDNRFNKVFWNLKFDVNFLKNHDIHVTRGEDAMILYFLANENEYNHQLKYTATKYIAPDAKGAQDVVHAYFKQHNCPHYGHIPVDILGPYGSLDAVYTLVLWHREWPRRIKKEDSLIKDGTREDIYKHEIAFTHLTARIERSGAPFDQSILTILAQPVYAAIEQLEEEIWELALDINEHIKPCNLNSDDQLANLMDQLGFKPVKYSKKTGKANWGKTELLQIPNRKFGEYIACYRNLTHSRDAFLEGLPEYARDGRIYPSYNQIGTRTGRASCSNPNLQQMPVRVPKYSSVPQYCTDAIKAAFNVRTAFRAPRGFKFVKIDESQFELRLLDHFAQDPNMHNAFLEGRDIHAEVACRLWNFKYGEFLSAYKTGDKEAKQFRDAAKECNFAVVYGAGPPRLRETLTSYGYKFQLNEVKLFYYRYFEIFPRIRDFVNRVQSTIRRRGYIFNQYGRHKRVPANKAYVGVNYLIQGITADMLKDGMIRIDNNVLTPEYKSDIILAVHDEVDFLIHEDELDIIPTLVGELQFFPWCRTPIVAEVSIGDSWGELTDLQLVS